MSKCKRMTVQAIGIDASGRTAYARNYNLNVCTAEPGNCGCIHAESALLETMPRPLVVIVTHSPCIDCAEKLVRAGVKKVEYLEEYRKRDGLRYLRKHKVRTYRIRPKSWQDLEKHVISLREGEEN